MALAVVAPFILAGCGQRSGPVAATPTVAGFKDAKDSFWPEPGIVGAIAVRGNHAFLGIGPRLVVVDVSQPDRLTIVGHAEYRPKESFRHPGVATSVALSGNYAFVTHNLVTRGEGDVDLVVFDVSNPAAPTVAGTYYIDHWGASALGVAVAGQHAYIYHTYGLEVVDISRPAAPKRAGRWLTPAKPGGGISIPVWDGTRGMVGHVVAAGPHVALEKNLAYLADRSGGLRILDVSDPAAPKEIGVCATRYYATGVVIEGKHAFVGVNYGLRIIDVSDPSQPKEIGSFNQERLVGAVPRAGHVLLYGPRIDDSGGRRGGLRVLDVSNPAAPREVHPEPDQAPTVDGGVVALALQDSHAYLGVGRQLVIVDVSDPRKPAVVGSTDGRGAAPRSP